MNYQAPLPTVTTTQSYSLVIRDMFFDAVLRQPFFQSGWTKRKCKQLSVQPQQIPYLGIYLIDETMTPDGDLNAGEIRFVHTLRLGFSVIIKNNDPVASERKLDEAFWSIMTGLWTDPYIMNWLDSHNPHTGYGNPDNVLVEGIQRGTRKHIWGTTSLDNELPIAELQYDVSAVYRTYWPPVIVDDLERINVQTVPLAHDGTIPPEDEVQRVFSEYDLTAEGGPVNSVNGHVFAVLGPVTSVP